MSFFFAPNAGFFLQSRGRLGLWFFSPQIYDCCHWGPLWCYRGGGGGGCWALGVGVFFALTFVPAFFHRGPRFDHSGFFGADALLGHGWPCPLLTFCSFFPMAVVSESPPPKLICFFVFLSYLLLLCLAVACCFFGCTQLSHLPPIFCVLAPLPVMFSVFDL